MTIASLLAQSTIQVRAVQGGQRPWLGGVYTSRDGGKSWVERNSGLETGLAAMACSVQ